MDSIVIRKTASVGRTESTPEELAEQLRLIFARDVSAPFAPSGVATGWMKGREPIGRPPSYGSFWGF